MSKAKSKFVCPECASPIAVWVDVDAELRFKVSSTGKLQGRVIENNYQTDGRCGVKCQECDWRTYGADVEEQAFRKLLENAYEQAEAIELTLGRSKPTGG